MHSWVDFWALFSVSGFFNAQIQRLPTDSCIRDKTFTLYRRPSPIWLFPSFPASNHQLHCTQCSNHEGDFSFPPRDYPNQLILCIGRLRGVIKKLNSCTGNLPILNLIPLCPRLAILFALNGYLSTVLNGITFYSFMRHWLPIYANRDGRDVSFELHYLK